MRCLWTLLLRLRLEHCTHNQTCSRRPTCSSRRAPAGIHVLRQVLGAKCVAQVLGVSGASVWHVHGAAHAKRAWQPAPFFALQMPFGPTKRVGCGHHFDGRPCQPLSPSGLEGNFFLQAFEPKTLLFPFGQQGFRPRRQQVKWIHARPTSTQSIRSNMPSNVKGPLPSYSTRSPLMSVTTNGPSSTGMVRT